MEQMHGMGGEEHVHMRTCILHTHTHTHTHTLAVMALPAPGAGTLKGSRQWTSYPLVGVQGIIDRWRADYCEKIVERNRVNETWRERALVKR